MPTLVVNDNSWGEGIGGLLGGLSAGNDPKRRAEAMALQARIDAQNLAARQTQIENENLLRLQKSREATAAAAEGQLTPDKFYRYVPETVTQPAPSPEFMGPMPQVPNPDRAALPDRLAAARTIARNAILHGTTAEGALKGAYGGLGLGHVYGAGIPQDENEARRLTTLVEGKVPSANVPMTEGARRRQAEEVERAAVRQKQLEIEAAAGRNQADIESRERIAEQERVRKREEDAQKDVVISSNQDVILGGNRQVPGYTPGQRIRGQTLVGEKTTVYGPDGQVLYRGAGATPTPEAPKTPEEIEDERVAALYSGQGVDPSQHRILLKIHRKIRTGGVESLTPEERDAWSSADEGLYGTRIEGRAGEKGTTEYYEVRRPRPATYLDPRAFGIGPSVTPPPPQQPGPAVPAAVPGQPTVGDQTRAPTAVPPGSAEGSTVKPGGAGANTTPTTTTYPVGTTGGSVTRTVIGEAKPEHSPEHVAKRFANKQSMHYGHQGMIQLFQEGYEPTVIGDVLTTPIQPSANQGVIGQLRDKLLAGGVNKAATAYDEKATRFRDYASQFLIGVLRDDTGAAIAREEWGYYGSMLVPAAGDSPERIAAKLARQKAMTEAREQGLSLQKVLDAGNNAPGTQVLPAMPPPQRIVQENPDELVPNPARAKAGVGAPAGSPAAAAPAAAPLRVPSGRPVQAGAVKGDLVLNPSTGEMEEVQ
jgi:hypothetical protein